MVDGEQCRHDAEIPSYDRCRRLGRRRRAVFVVVVEEEEVGWTRRRKEGRGEEGGGEGGVEDGSGNPPLPIAAVVVNVTGGDGGVHHGRERRRSRSTPRPMIASSPVHLRCDSFVDAFHISRLCGHEFFVLLFHFFQEENWIYYYLSRVVQFTTHLLP